MLASLGLQTLSNRDQSVSSSDCSISPTVVLREQHRSRGNDVETARENATPAASPTLALALQAAYEPSPAVDAAVRAAPATSLVIDGSLMQRTSPSSPGYSHALGSEAASLLPEQLPPHKTCW